MSCAEIEKILDIPEPLRSQDERALLSSHVLICPDCMARQAQMESALQSALSTRAEQPLPSPSTDFRARLAARLAEAGPASTPLSPVLHPESAQAPAPPPTPTAASRALSAQQASGRPAGTDSRRPVPGLTSGPPPRTTRWLGNHRWSLGAALAVFLAAPFLWQLNRQLSSGSADGASPLPLSGSPSPIQFRGNTATAGPRVELRLLQEGTGDQQPSPVVDGAHLKASTGLLMRFEVEGGQQLTVWAMTPSGQLESLFERRFPVSAQPERGTAPSPGSPAHTITLSLEDSAGNPMQYRPDAGAGTYTFVALLCTTPLSQAELESAVKARLLDPSNGTAPTNGAATPSAEGQATPGTSAGQRPASALFSVVQVVYE